MKAGAEPEALWECLRGGLAGRMTALHESIPRWVFQGRFEPATYTLALARKDVGLATELAREYNVPVPIGNLVERTAIEGMNRGWGDKNPAVLFLLQEEAASVEVRAPAMDPEKAAAATPGWAPAPPSA